MSWILEAAARKGAAAKEPQGRGVSCLDFLIFFFLLLSFSLKYVSSLDVT